MENKSALRSSYTIKGNRELAERIVSSFPLENTVFNKTETIYSFTQYDECNITIYKTWTVLFQGKNAYIYYQSFKPASDVILPQAGSDEVGTGSFFGPVTVCACYMDEVIYEKVKDLNLIDTKQMNDENIRETAPVLIKEVPHSLLILDNEKYNEINQKYNMNRIKAMMHNKCFINLIHKGVRLPELTVIDQFCSEELYYSYISQEKEKFEHITFHTRAENQFVSVAAGAIISRYSFLVELDRLSRIYDVQIPSGAGSSVDETGALLVRKYGPDILRKTAKLNFRNTEKIRELL